MDLTLVRHEHVLEAIAECDRLGPTSFLTTYGFEPTHEDLLMHDGRDYDSKAILGVAHRLATGAPSTVDEPSEEPTDPAETLRELGFDVRTGDEDDPAHRTVTAAAVGSEHARATWALAAREVLIEAARTYHAVVPSKDLAAAVQRRSLIETDQRAHYWIGDVLSRVAAECANRDEPLLSALCVDATGSVGAGYSDVVQQLRGDAPADGDLHAAEERLACYRRFGAKLPAGGGTPALTKQLKDRRDKVSAAAWAARPVELCPVHRIELPVNGECDLCN